MIPLVYAEGPERSSLGITAVYQRQDTLSWVIPTVPLRVNGRCGTTTPCLSCDIREPFRARSVMVLRCSPHSGVQSVGAAVCRRDGPGGFRRWSVAPGDNRGRSAAFAQDAQDCSAAGSPPRHDAGSGGEHLVVSWPPGDHCPLRREGASEPRPHGSNHAERSGNARSVVECPTAPPVVADADQQSFLEASGVARDVFTLPLANASRLKGGRPKRKERPHRGIYPRLQAAITVITSHTDPD